jgi:hypothetical protein
MAMSPGLNYCMRQLNGSVYGQLFPCHRRGSRIKKRRKRMRKKKHKKMLKATRWQHRAGK